MKGLPMALSPRAIGVIFGVVITVVIILINSLVIWALSKGFKLKKKKYVTALTAAAAIGAVNFLTGMVIPSSLSSTLTTLIELILVFAISSAAMKLFYRLQAKKSLLFGGILTAAWLVITLIVGMITALLFVLAMHSSPNW